MGGTNSSGLTQRNIIVNGQNYALENVLGEGGFGTVYAARNMSGMPVAIKETRLAQLRPEDMHYIARMYLNEIRLLKKLQQFNQSSIVYIIDYDFNPVKGAAYLVEERGIPLEHMFGENGVVHEPQRKHFFKGMTQAVAVLHGNQIVHADLKPGNFILVGPHIKLIDLGTSFDLPEYKVAAKRTAIGTPGYMAPEQQGVRGRAIYGYKSDIYSLGAILHEMTFGEIATPGIPLPHPNPYITDLLLRTLQPNPMLRPTVQQLLLHPYVLYY